MKKNFPQHASAKKITSKNGSAILKQDENIKKLYTTTETPKKHGATKKKWCNKKKNIHAEHLCGQMRGQSQRDTGIIYHETFHIHGQRKK